VSVQFLPADTDVVPPPGQAPERPPAPVEARGPRRFWLRSLSSKLVAGVVVLVFLLVTASGVSTFYALKYVLYNRLDQQVSATAKTGSILNLLNPRQRFGGGVSLPQTVSVVVISSATGVPTSYQPTGPDLNALSLSSSTLKSLAGKSTGPASRLTTDHRQLRTMTVSGLELSSTDASGNTTEKSVTVIIGLSEADVDRTLSRTILIEVLIGAAAILLAFAATSYGVRRSLRNLYQVTGTAREVAAELSPEGAGLDRRVPVVEEGTEVGQLAESMNTLLSAVETQFAARLESEQRMRQFLADANDQTPNYDAVDVPMMVDDAVAGARASFPNRQIDLQVVAVPFVWGDRDQLLRIVRNLVTNACVHTQEDRPILVRAFPDAGGVTIQVIDGGPGLPEDEAAHVFERFWRADKARTRARGGSGLGLSIVATLVRAHGGQVAFASSVEHGSTVTVWLPSGNVTPDPMTLPAIGQAADD
jgi:two-component system OmpR family sensor kinase